MLWVANLLLDFLVLAGMIHRIRDDRRRGIKIDWFRTLVFLLYITVVTGVGLAFLILLLEFDRAAIGVLAFVLVMAAGAFGLYILANRVWPDASGTGASGVEKDK